MKEWISAALLLIGALFSLLAAIGIVRMPDFYARVQATTKASTLGVGSLVLAAAMHFQGTGPTAQALLVVAFLTLTAPVAAQMLARAAYAEGVPHWQEIIDELRTSHRDPQLLPENVPSGDDAAAGPMAAGPPRAGPTGADASADDASADETTAD